MNICLPAEDLKAVVFNGRQDRWWNFCMHSESGAMRAFSTFQRTWRGQYSGRIIITFIIKEVYMNLARRRQWHPTSVLLPGKSRGWRNLVGCRSWGHWESDMTEWLHFHFSLSCIGEGNGNPLQCSCLENPRDGGAWWAAIYGITTESDMTATT